MTRDGAELDRIRQMYSLRESRGAGRYSVFEPAALLERQQRERYLLSALARFGLRDLTRVRILDVGCGTGEELRRIISYGAEPAHLHGIDLLIERLVAAGRLAPQVNFACAGASNLPYGNDQFDLVMQFTVFSSILDNAIRASVAREMLRVLAPDGLIVWYDFWLNPTNPNVRGVKPPEVRTLFPACSCYFQRLTLAPPIARPIAKRSFLLCQLLAHVPFLLSHYLAIIKPSNPFPPA